MEQEKIKLSFVDLKSLLDKKLKNIDIELDNQNSEIKKMLIDKNILDKDEKLVGFYTNPQNQEQVESNLNILQKLNVEMKSLKDKVRLELSLEEIQELFVVSLEDVLMCKL